MRELVRSSGELPRSAAELARSDVDLRPPKTRLGRPGYPRPGRPCSRAGRACILPAGGRDTLPAGRTGILPVRFAGPRKRPCTAEAAMRPRSGPDPRTRFPRLIAAGAVGMLPARVSDPRPPSGGYRSGQTGQTVNLLGSALRGFESLSAHSGQSVHRRREKRDAAAPLERRSRRTARPASRPVKLADPLASTRWLQPDGLDRLGSPSRPAVGAGPLDRRRQRRRSRGVAQLGRALRSGRRGRRFKSYHPDFGSFAVPATTVTLRSRSSLGLRRLEELQEGAVHGGLICGCPALRRAEAQG